MEMTDLEKPRIQDNEHSTKMQQKMPSQDILPEFLGWPMFWFPVVVNKTGARVIGVQVSLTCLATIITYIIDGDNDMGGYISLFLFVDYIMRFLAGGPASIYGQTAGCVAHFLPREMTPGAQKQFASVCGASMAGAACLAFFLDDSGIAGCIVLGGLFGASSLEGYGGFCLGCWMYGYFRNNPTVKKYIRQIWGWEDSIIDEHTRTANWVYDKQTEEPKLVIAKFDAPKHSVYLKYRTKSDEWRKEDFDLVRHCGIGYFAMPMSIAGTALAFKLNTSVPDGLPDDTWRAIAWGAVVVYALLQLLYVLKFVRYPSKVFSEWNHPLYRNFFATIPITWLVFAYLLNDYSHFREFLFYAGGCSVMYIAVVSLTRLVKEPQNMDVTDPSVMLAPVGTLVAAVIAPLVDNTEVGWFWFSVGLFFWLALFAVMLNRLAFRVPLSNAATPSLFIFIAAPAVAQLAWSSLNKIIAFDAAARVFFWIAAFSFVWMAYLVVHNYFFRAKFNMGYWGYVFPLATLSATCTSFYLHILTTGNFTKAAKNMAWGTLCLVGYVGALYTVATLNMLIRKRIFVAPEKFGPLAFMKVIHFAFREAIVNMAAQAEEMKENAQNAERVKDLLVPFKKLFDVFHLMHDEHSKHEDTIVFKAFNEFFPGHPQQAYDEHERDHHATVRLHATIGKLEAAVQEAAPTPAAPRAFAVMRLAHEAFRGSLKDLAESLEAGDVDAFREEWGQFNVGFEAHAAMEDDGFFPLLDNMFDQAATKGGLLEQHATSDKLHHALHEVVASKADLAAVKAAFAPFAEDFEQHMTREEKVMMPLTKKTANTPQARAAVVNKHIISVLDKQKHPEEFVSYVLGKLRKHKPAKASRMFSWALQAVSTAEQWQRFLPVVQKAVEPKLFQKMCEDIGIDGPGKIGAADKQDEEEKKEVNVAQLVEDMTGQLVELFEHLDEHFKGEENHMNPIGQKYVPIAYQVELTRRVFESTPVDVWAKLLPFILNNQFIHKRRVKFLQAFRWAMPEKMQLIGKLVYGGVDDLLWARLIADVPEMIPRHVAGWQRML